MKTPLLQIVTAFYNREKYVRRTLDSIKAQSFSDYLVYVIDDGSSDGTAEAVESYCKSDCRFVPIVKSNTGFTDSIKQSISLSDSKYIAVVGSGDCLHVDKLRKQIELLEANSDISVSATSSQNLSEVDGSLIDTQRWPAEDLARKDFENTVPFTHGSVVMRRDSYDACGGYDQRFDFCQDWDLWLKMIRVGRINMMSEVLYDRYVLMDGASFSPEKAVKQLKYKHMALWFDTSGLSCEPSESWLSERIKLDLITRYFKLRLMGEDGNSIRTYIDRNYGGMGFKFGMLSSFLSVSSRLGVSPTFYAGAGRNMIESYRRVFGK